MADTLLEPIIDALWMPGREQLARHVPSLNRLPAKLGWMLSMYFGCWVSLGIVYLIESRSAPWACLYTQAVMVFGAFVLMFKIVADYLTRKRLIEKGLVDEKVKYLYRGSAEAQALSNLKWGIVLIGIGLAAVLSYWFPDSVSEEGTIGLMFIFGGVGFLAYYFMAPRMIKKNRESQVE